MSRKRPSDTAAIVAANKPSRGRHESLTVEVRPIQNGYVTRHSRYTGDGFESREFYSPDKPDLGLAETSTRETSSLRRATDYLNKPTET